MQIPFFYELRTLVYIYVLAHENNVKTVYKSLTNTLERLRYKHHKKLWMTTSFTYKNGDIKIELNSIIL